LCRQNGKGDGKADRRAYKKGDRKVNGKGDKRENRKKGQKYWNLSMRDTPLRRSESGLPAEVGSPRRVRDEQMSLNPDTYEPVNAGIKT
jgi:hypothetical protein